MISEHGRIILAAFLAGSLASCVTHYPTDKNETFLPDEARGAETVRIVADAAKTGKQRGAIELSNYSYGKWTRCFVGFDLHPIEDRGIEGAYLCLRRKRARNVDGENIRLININKAIVFVRTGVEWDDEGVNKRIESYYGLAESIGKEETEKIVTESARFRPVQGGTEIESVEYLFSENETLFPAHSFSRHWDVYDVTEAVKKEWAGDKYLCLALYKKDKVVRIDWNAPEIVWFGVGEKEYGNYTPFLAVLHKAADH